MKKEESFFFFSPSSFQKFPRRSGYIQHTVFDRDWTNSRQTRGADSSYNWYKLLFFFNVPTPSFSNNVPTHSATAQAGISKPDLTEASSIFQSLQQPGNSKFHTPNVISFKEYDASGVSAEAQLKEKPRCHQRSDGGINDLHLLVIAITFDLVNESGR